MRTLSTVLAALLVLAAFLPMAHSDQAVAAESQAKSWNLSGEVKARFEAKVVDILCELAGDCVDACGGGERHLGLLKPDGTLILAAKNIQAIFSGSAVDLAPYCGKQVEVDGLMVGEGGPQIYQVQWIKEVGAESFNKTNLWSKQWDAENPDMKDVKEPWFRKDKRIKARLEEDGYLGLGLETDRKYIAEEQ